MTRVLLSILLFFEVESSAHGMEKMPCAETYLNQYKECGLFRYVNGSNVRMQNASLKNFQFEMAIAFNFELVNVDLSGSTFRGVKFIDSKFDNSNLSQVEFYGVRFENVTFSKIDLQNTRFVRCFFRNVEFQDSKVRKEQFVDPVFVGASPI